MRALLLFALAFHMTLGPVCMMHTAYAAESHYDHTMTMHETLVMSSNCPDCIPMNEAAAHDSCAGRCVSVQEPDLLTLAPQTPEMPTAIVPADVLSMEIGWKPVASMGESIPRPSSIPLQSVVLLL